MGIENNSENRKAFRDMILVTPNIESYISGVVLSPETAVTTVSTG